MDGQINLESEENRGTTVTFTVKESSSELVRVEEEKYGESDEDRSSDENYVPRYNEKEKINTFRRYSAVYHSSTFINQL